MNNENKAHKTALMFTSQYGYAESTDLLIEAGADVNRRYGHGNTVLMLAVINNHRQCLELLIHSGVDVNAANDYNDTALIQAAVRVRPNFVRMLLHEGAHVNIENKRVEYHGVGRGVKQKNKTMVLLMFAAGENIDSNVLFRIGGGSSNERNELFHF